MRIRNVGASVLLAVVPVATVACSKDDSASATTSTPTTTAAPASKGFQVSTPDGQASLSLDGQLPPGWPNDFPLPKSAEPAGSGSLGETDSTVRIAVYTTTGTGQETLGFFVDNPELETKDPSSAGAGQSFLGSVDLVSPYAGSVTVLSRDGKGYLVVTLEEGAAAGSSTTTSTTGASTTTTAGTTTG